MFSRISKLEDPRTGKRLLERTILIANTEHAGCRARSVDLHTGITMAEYYRDMGYDKSRSWRTRPPVGRKPCAKFRAVSKSSWRRRLPGRILPRLAAFYERAGKVETLAGQPASVSIIGAISPAGGDFSEPVTESTKRFVSAFYSLDRKLAYARHFLAINWINLYSAYANQLAGWYEQHTGPDFNRPAPTNARHPPRRGELAGNRAVDRGGSPARRTAPDSCDRTAHQGGGSCNKTPSLRSTATCRLKSSTACCRRWQVLPGGAKSARRKVPYSRS